MTEALQRSVESNQTADIFDIAQISPKDKVQICYSYADMEFLVVDIDAHVDTGWYRYMVPENNTLDNPNLPDQVVIERGGGPPLRRNED